MRKNKVVSYEHDYSDGFGQHWKLTCENGDVVYYDGDPGIVLGRYVDYTLTQAGKKVTNEDFS